MGSGIFLCFSQRGRLSWASQTVVGEAGPGGVFLEKILAFRGGSPD